MNSIFVLAQQGYGSAKAPGSSNLLSNEFRCWPSKGYPNMNTRYRFVTPTVIQVESWIENNVKTKGVLGRPCSKLMARWHVKKAAPGYLKTGSAKVWYWNGALKESWEFELTGKESKIVRHIQYDKEGRLTYYLDASRGKKNPRTAKFESSEEGRVIKHWRGKYHEKVINYDGAKTVRRNAGLPLVDNGNWLLSEFNTDNVLISESCYVAGLQHGFSRTFNKSGRVIFETYWLRGIQIPDWVYLDPEGVTPEEIQDEESEELRAIMLELQGTELYQIRAMSRSPRALARTRITEIAELELAAVSATRPSIQEEQ